MAFNIGDRIKIKDYADIPTELKAKFVDGNPHLWNAGKAKACGRTGTIKDVFYSNAYDCYVYQVQYDEDKYPTQTLFDEDAFVPYDTSKCTYDFDIQQLDSLVVVVMYSVCGDERVEIARGHGHIIHEAEKGIAQATSYALKKIYEKLNGGEI